MRIAVESNGKIKLMTNQVAPFPAGAVISPSNWNEIQQIPKEYLLIEDGEVREMTQLEKDEYDMGRLEELKKEKMSEIDAKTNQLILSGFEYNGHFFSMSTAAQRNWSGLAAAHSLGMLPIPMPVSTVDEDQYFLQDSSEVLAFLGAYLMYQTDPTKPLHQGRVLRAQVRAATSPSEVRAVVDNR